MLIYIVSILVSIEKDDEGYTCPTCTVFGLDDSEARSLVKSGYSLVNNGNDEEGYEVKSSAYKASSHFSIEVLRQN